MNDQWLVEFDLCGLSIEKTDLILVQQFIDQLYLIKTDYVYIRDLMSMLNEPDLEWFTLFCLLWHEMNNGSICIPTNESYIQEKLGPINQLSSQIIKKISLIPQEGEINKLLTEQEGYLYLQRMFVAEKDLKNSLSKFIAANSLKPDTNLVKQAINDVLSTTAYSLEPEQILAIINATFKSFCIVSGGPGTGKTTIMLSVLRVLMRLDSFNGINEIMLAAPTGRAAKRMTEALHKGLEHDVIDQTLEESKLLSLEATTIHRLIGSNPIRDSVRHNANNPLQMKLLIIDEVSMVDIALMNQLLAALPPNCRVLLLGDQYQLPSVNAGSVLADLMPPEGMKIGYTRDLQEKVKSVVPEVNSTFFSDAISQQITSLLQLVSNDHLTQDCITILNKSKRCQQDIATYSQFVKDVNLDEAKAYQQARIRSLKSVNFTYKNEEEGILFSPILPQEKLSNFQQYYSNWFEQHFLLENSVYLLTMQKLVHSPSSVSDYHLQQLFLALNDARILCAARSGQYGVHAMNRYVCNMLSEVLYSQTMQQNDFAGKAIILAENDASLNLFNGDTGIILEDPDSGELRAFFEMKDQFRSFSLSSIPHYETAFAMTVHKSQGSEFKNVLMVLPDDPTHRLLIREVLYTGITRAKKQAVIMSTQESLNIAIRNSVTRYSGLRI
ncbi:MAG: exodeoxyribonuclease V subunit alpha [Lentisphaeria bacterium]|nr:exodeoxyribonuclease V subunit alpha [Lentisphaeria bacterium]